jgi:hypothetical protein
MPYKPLYNSPKSDNTLEINSVDTKIYSCLLALILAISGIAYVLNIISFDDENENILEMEDSNPSKITNLSHDLDDNKPKLELSIKDELKGNKGMS